METAILGGAIANVISKNLITPLITQIEDLYRLAENRKELQGQLIRLRSLLFDINAQFQGRQKRVPRTVENCLERIKAAVEKAENLINRSQSPQRYLDCLFCKFNVSRKIKECGTRFEKLFNDLQRDLSIFWNARQSIYWATPEDDVLLQDVPEDSYVWVGFKDAQKQLEKWIITPKVRVIGLYGMPGAGKTSLLKILYNNEQRRRPAIFDHVIWITLSQGYKIFDLQGRIAQRIDLDIVSNPDIDTRKMKLSTALRKKKFLLVLDEMWAPINLMDLGVELLDHKSTVLFSTRNKELIPAMNTVKSIQIKPLTSDEAWDLFCQIAFKNSSVPPDREAIAREVASECKGLPLAINVIASTLIGKDAYEWRLALSQMLGSNLSTTYPHVDRDLYQRLRRSYDCLPNESLKNCFLYGAMFPKDEILVVDKLLGMWISEGFVKVKQEAYLMDTAHSYIKLLADRCLFNVEHKDIGSKKILSLKTHDILREMATTIAEQEQNYLCRAGQRLGHFPDYIDIPENCKRISVCCNNITSLPSEPLRCTELVSLILTGNNELKEIPEAFLERLVSLKVLDVSKTQIQSLPVSVWQLTQLEFLSLSSTRMEIIPEGIGNLCKLQFLDLSLCGDLNSLSPQIEKLKNLKYLNLYGCGKLSSLSSQLGGLKSLKYFISNFQFPRTL